MLHSRRLSGSSPLDELAFDHDALKAFARALDSIRTFPVAFRELSNDFVSDGGRHHVAPSFRELDRLAYLKFVSHHHSWLDDSSASAAISRPRPRSAPGGSRCSRRDVASPRRRNVSHRPPGKLR